MTNNNQTHNGSPKFGFKSSYDLYEKLRVDSERLSATWHHYEAFDFLITAYHLFHDWKKCEKKGELSRLKRNEDKLPSEMKLVLNTVRDLVNSNKHFILKKAPSEKSKITEVHSGLEAGWYSYFFHEDTYGVSVEGGWYFSVNMLHNILMEYFEWVFEDLKLEFPIQLLEKN